MDVIGFEGHFRQEHAITWGCAAIRDGDKVINACTGFASTEWDEYVEDGVVTVLDEPLHMGSDWKSDGGIVLALRFDIGGERLQAPGIDMFQASRARGFAKQKGWLAYFYEGTEPFREDFVDYQRRLVTHIDSLLKTGLVLHVHALDLNVIRTAIECLRRPEDANDRMDFRKQLGDAILRSPSDHEMFKRIFGVGDEV